MATSPQKLVASLDALRELQGRGVVAIRSADLSRTHRERLERGGFLREVMKGWYIPARPDEAVGESTAWYASFWAFCAAYLRQRFDEEWCLSPEQSLALHAGNEAVPRQLLVRSPRARNKATALPFETSILDVRATLPRPKDIHQRDGLRMFSPPAALIASSPGFFERNATDARTVLAMIRDASELLPGLLEGGHSVVAGRMVGALRNSGRGRIADDILAAMRAAGHAVRERDPFASTMEPARLGREASPYAGRIRLMWRQMRGAVVDRFPAPPGRPRDINAYLRRVRDVYVADAYHSLSIEGYRVSAGLIERVRSGKWNPDTDERDRERRDGLAARGYWQAHQAVEKSLRKVLRGRNPGAVADADHGTWYRQMFAPGVTAGLLRSTDLAGYRDGQVFIRRSHHVPMRAAAVQDAMPVFFDMLREEREPSVRVVLGHFLFVYIHPYVDGNGRIGRFLMNVMLGASGYPWTIVPLVRRDAYMATLEEASVRQDIVPFTDFLARLVREGLRGKAVAKVPKA